MPNNPSYDVFHRATVERYNQFREALNAARNAFASQPAGERERRAQVLLDVASRLNDNLAEIDRPKWLRIILSATRSFVELPNDKTATAFLDAIATHYGSISSIVVSDDSTFVVNFDAVYQKCRDDGNIPHLFDELIRITSHIIESGEIESITALGALQHIINLLKANRGGSFLAARQSISIARYLKHLVDVVLEKVPVLKELREAYDRTVAEADDEFKRVDIEIRNQTIRTISEKLPRLDRLSEYRDQLSITVVQYQLPSPSDSVQDGDR